MRTTGEPNGNRWSGVARCLDGACRGLGPRDGREEWRGEADNKPRSAGDKEEQRRHARGGSSAATGQPVCMALGGTQTGVSRHPRSAAVEHFDPWARKGKNRTTGHLRDAARTGEALPGGSAQGLA
ncbi:hypothetical protein ERJ75_000371600 [Trypanosoma vivax]|nr:hypothetical protein ERJ75_000371600 [Trypanosoma vivax]